tara:strand:- start:933 stop:1247 length:315 start_codon:yes stop_codon:yes gene_type:complete
MLQKNLITPHPLGSNMKKEDIRIDDCGHIVMDKDMTSLWVSTPKGLVAIFLNQYTGLYHMTAWNTHEGNKMSKRKVGNGYFKIAQEMEGTYGEEKARFRDGMKA